MAPTNILELYAFLPSYPGSMGLELDFFPLDLGREFKSAWPLPKQLLRAPKTFSHCLDRPRSGNRYEELGIFGMDLAMFKTLPELYGSYQPDCKYLQCFPFP